MFKAHVPEPERRVKENLGKWWRGMDPGEGSGIGALVPETHTRKTLEFMVAKWKNKCGLN